MSENTKTRAQSPFAALSFGEQQEQWRAWRAQKLDFRQAEAPARAQPQPVREIQAAQADTTSAASDSPRRAPSPFRPAPPAHGNLDRVKARMNAATGRAAHYLPTSKG